MNQLQSSLQPRCRPSTPTSPVPSLAGFVAMVLLGNACAGFPDSAPETTVMLDNRYPPAIEGALVVYDAFWQTVSFRGKSIEPGACSAPQSAVPTSGDVAYAVLATGWVPTGTTPPASFIVLESKGAFAVALGETLHIPVDDLDFAGHCPASPLAQAQADFLTQIVFSDDFVGRLYDAATCTTTSTGASGAR